MQVALFLPRVAALVLVLLLAHIVGAAATGLAAPPPPAESSAAISQEAPASAERSPPPRAPDVGASLKLLALVIAVCVLEAMAIAAVLLSAHAHGWRLVGGLAIATFGVVAVQPQVEAVAFGVVRAGLALRIIGMGAAVAVIVAPLGVLIFWRVRPRRGDPAHAPAGPGWSGRAWAGVAAAAVIYVAVYLVFGYFIAWRSPVVRAYYGGGDPAGSFSHLAALQSRAPWFVPLQLLRGALWAGLGWVILSLLRGPRWRGGAVLGVFLAVMMNAQLLLPNAFMPEAVRLVHIAETAPSNFMFGAVLPWVLGASRGRGRRVPSDAS